jgi:hypothetical protein
MMLYNANDWYWNVDGPHLWSSASLSYVKPTDPKYLAWSQRGNYATDMTDKVGMLEVMIRQVQPIIMAQGIVLQNDPGGSYALTDANLTIMGNLSHLIAAGHPLMGGGETFNFIDVNGVQHAFTGEEFTKFVHACHSYMYNWSQALAIAINGGKVKYPSNKISI